MISVRRERSNTALFGTGRESLILEDSENAMAAGALQKHGDFGEQREPLAALHVGMRERLG